VSPEVLGSTVLHGEPHNRNRLTRNGSTVYIDFEGACVGPIEWDLAYVPDRLAVAIWPAHDARRRSVLQLGVSTCVSVACWRHVSARPDDAEMRWHADHHLSLVRRRLT
jgi:aminoglycoside phosphotransferase (APT) family kinase protein